MDATLAMGPISLSLLGFEIGIPIKDIQLDKLSSMTAQALATFIDNIKVDLHGMAMSFNKPPLLIAGVFEHGTSEVAGRTSEYYRGGIGVSFPPYVFVAVGSYDIVTDTMTKKTYKSIFVFAKLDGPLVTLEFATISNVRLGFGYNSIVRAPANDELTVFPFISDSGVDGAGNDPLMVLKSMAESKDSKPAWVSPKEDSYWFALGMSISAAEILQITAVAMLGFRDSGIVVSIYADGIAQLPAQKVPPSESIVYIEIGMVAEMNFIEGYFRVEASLAPTSFIYVPQCNVYGG